MDDLIKIFSSNNVQLTGCPFSDVSQFLLAAKFDKFTILFLYSLYKCSRTILEHFFILFLNQLQASLKINENPFRILEYLSTWPRPRNCFDGQF